MPIKLKTKLIFNLFENKGFISIYFFSFKVMLRNWYIKTNRVVLKDFYNKKKDILIWFGGKNENEKNVFSDIFFNKLLFKIKIKSFKVYSNFGFKNNVYLTFYITAFLNICAGVFKSLIFNTKKVKNMEVALFPSFLKNNSMFCFSLAIQINLFVVLNCLIISLLKTISGGKNGN